MMELQRQSGTNHLEQERLASDGGDRTAADYSNLTTTATTPPSALAAE
jgi:hypothetical protein